MNEVMPLNISLEGLWFVCNAFYSFSLTGKTNVKC